MLNPGNFHRARNEFLDSTKEEYAKAVKDDNVKEVHQDICRWYYLRFPVSKGDSYEPTQAELAAVDDNAAPTCESNPEGWDSMTDNERSTALKEHSAFVRAKNAVGAQLT